MRPEVVMHGRSGLDDAIAVIERRMVESSQYGDRRLPLTAARCAAARNYRPQRDTHRWSRSGTHLDAGPRIYGVGR